MALTTVTYLQAINTMLSTIGESPLNSISEAPGVVDAATAKKILDEVTIQVQQEGWPFNTEHNVILTPDIDGYIQLPDTVLQLQADGNDEGWQVVQRGKRLYDRDNHTYTFSKSVSVTWIIVLEFEDLPQAAKHYIMTRAARIFQQRVVGSDTLNGFTEKDEVRSRAALQVFCADTGSFNILSDNWSVQRTLSR